MRSIMHWQRSCMSNVMCAIYYHFYVGELHHAVNLSRPKLIFASAAVAPRALKISAKNPFVKQVVTIDMDGNNTPSKRLSTKHTTSYSALITSIKVNCCRHSARKIGFYFISFLCACCRLTNAMNSTVSRSI